MKVIYVAGKYSGKGYSEIEDNIKRAEKASIKLFRKGWAVITPHKNTAHYEIYEDETLTYEMWLAADMEMLKRSDAIFLLNGWQNSHGAVKEQQYALGNNMPVFYEDEGIPEPNMIEKEVVKV